MLNETTTSVSPGSCRTVYITLPPELEILQSVDLTVTVENPDTIRDGSGVSGQGGYTAYQGSLMPGISSLYTEVYVRFAGDLSRDNWAAGNGVKTGALVITDAGVELLRASLTATVAKTTGYVRAALAGDVAAQPKVARVYAFQSTDSRLRVAGVSGPVGGSTAGSVLLASYDYSSSVWGIPGNTVAVPNGDYYIQCFTDVDGNEYLGTGEPATFRQVVVDGNTEIAVDGADRSAAAEPSFAITAPGSLPDGTVIVRFLALGTYEPADPQCYVGLYIGTLSAGTLTPFLVGAVPAGAYDLYVHLDADNGVNLGAYPPNWDIDTGDYVRRAANVTVTSAPVSLNGASIAAVP